MKALATSGRENLRFAGAHCYFRRAVLVHCHSVYTALHGTHRDTWGTQFDFSVMVAQNAECHRTAGDLKKISLVFKLGQADLGVPREPNHVCPVKLHFGARGGSRYEAILYNQWSVNHGCYEVAGITAAKGNIAVDDADTRNSSARLILVIVRKKDCRGEKESEWQFARHGQHR